MIYFFLNFIALVIIFLFFNRKINKSLSLKEIKFEINQSINLFNRNLEAKILNIERKMEKYSKYADEIDKKSLKLKKMINGFEKNEQKFGYFSFFKPKTDIKITKKYKKNESLREKILRLKMEDGLGNKEIAHKLSITTDEVKLNLVK